ncbi:hypothetical protein TPHA_0A04610 [Tetrapisispora phaffii CBS 4417]|uniref:Uncharacterized protein n=1 Tax=Tetrapisispora phaffii (strain ATCC 24235 / CBS 4417 / NBRC 1672 / NRRL Y-8282 / UCD 70-5) TaxID=1071381 RepID=G8BNQ6_TETPH|nr:hypothetical protein TPHA_0A04610 [Tetrapisispora phaffii CBS 4417]CCE61534.1 hypothetical protein TPHA_0A04610 [Tetrapisispora phaffii CBS 4417]
MRCLSLIFSRSLGNLAIDYSYLKQVHGVYCNVVTPKTPAISIEESDNKLTNEYSLELPLEYRTNIYKTKNLNYNPINAAAAKLRGIPSLIHRIRYQEKLFAKEANVYSCDYFSLTYFPPNHFLSLFRKSKPSICVLPLMKQPFNGEIVPKDITNDKTLTDEFYKNFEKQYQAILKKYPSIIPKDYAFIRRNIQVMTKRTFIEQWSKLSGDKAISELIEYGSESSKEKSIFTYIDGDGNSLKGVAKDGYYHYQIFKYPSPNEHELFRDNIKRSVDVVAKLVSIDNKKEDKNQKKIDWVTRDNDRISLKKINSLLRQHDLPLLIRNKEKP